ncbi:MAG: hypothetical protein A2204_03080, partial [Elusimicrobia bacterium RIFOXYA1_FULL_47_7]
MKNVFFVAVLFAAGLFVSGCATVAAPVNGGLYMNVKGPLAVSGNPTGTKMGTAECVSILGIVATGDASIQAAAKSAGITKIHHVDYKSTSILGLYSSFTVEVYG